MKIIIAGAGEVGTHLAGMLANENHAITVIDPDEDRLKFISNFVDVRILAGTVTSFSHLHEADIESTDMFIAVTPSEETNLTASIMAKKLGAKKCIARINNTEFLTRELFKELGIDHLICPEKLAADEIIGLIRQSGATEVYDFSGGKLSLFVIKLDENAPIVNKSMLETARMAPLDHFRVVAITRSGRTIIPKGSDFFLPGDFVYVITLKNHVDELLKFAGKEHFKIKSAIILGGSRIGVKTARGIENYLNVKLFEKDKEKCDKLSEILTNTLVINGDGTNVDLLEEENIRNMDAFIAVTGNSETNILSCMVAKRFGVKKTIAEVENTAYFNLAESIGIDTIINKKLITASHIFRFTMDANVSFLRCLTGTKAEVMEFIVQKDALITKNELRKIDFPQDAIIGGYIRGSKSYIAKGDTQIKENDRVVVFALPSAINKIGRYFN